MCTEPAKLASKNDYNLLQSCTNNVITEEVWEIKIFRKCFYVTVAADNYSYVKIILKWFKCLTKTESVCNNTCTLYVSSFLLTVKLAMSIIM